MIKHLSKGYKQRLGLAQGILHEPEVLILDEPTIGLDPIQIIEVRQLIRELAGKHTVILSTHILPEVSMTCQRVVIIDRGRVVAEDRPENLMAKLKGAEQISLVVAGPSVEVQQCLSQIPGVTAVTLVMPLGESKARYEVTSTLHSEIANELARTIIQRGWDLFELKRAEMSLEEVFLRLTTHE